MRTQLSDDYKNKNKNKNENKKMSIDPSAVAQMLQKQVVTFQENVKVLKEHIDHAPPKVRAAYLLAHQLKGSAACMGFDDLGAVAADIHNRIEISYENKHDDIDAETRAMFSKLEQEAAQITVAKSSLYQKLARPLVDA